MRGGALHRRKRGKFPAALPTKMWLLIVGLLIGRVLFLPSRPHLLPPERRRPAHRSPVQRRVRHPYGSYPSDGGGGTAAAAGGRRGHLQGLDGAKVPPGQACGQPLGGRGYGAAAGVVGDVREQRLVPVGGRCGLTIGHLQSLLILLFQSVPKIPRHHLP